MTMHVLSAGDGYTYYTSEVATGDVKREQGRDLGDYYTAEGNPPGVWMGSGTAHLGVTGEVTEAQMKALFGEGLHPDADQIIAAKLADGATVEQAQQAAKLGRKYYEYSQTHSPVRAAMATAIDTFERKMHRESTEAERRQIRLRVGAVEFQTAKGRPPGSSEELAKFITAATRPAQQAVAGFDMVFSPAKSVSVLWALGDQHTRTVIEQAHTDAIAATVVYIEREAVATRAGVNGVAQIDVDGGLVATRFRHFDSRTGDPQLHDHLVVANKVKGADGKWRTIDSKLLHRMNVPASEYYNHDVLARVAAALNVTVEARTVTAGKRAVLEIAGVDERLLDVFSTRSMNIRQATKALQKEYRAQHGRNPDQKALVRLAQQATLDTRPAKPKRQPLSVKLAGFRSRAADTIGRRAADHVTATAQEHARTTTTPTAEVDVATAAAAVLATVSEHHAVFGPHVVEAEARRWVAFNAFAAPDRDELVRRIAGTAVGDAVTITPPQPHQFQALQNTDQRSIYAHKGTELLTSRTVLTAETDLLAAARTPAIAPVTDATFEQVVAAHTGPLDAGQEALARAFATTTTQIHVGIGPAGAGKTTTMKVATAAVRNAGGTVVALAPSSAAAKVLGAELGTPASTLHGYLTARKHGHGPHIGAGDVVLVDEAGMAGTVTLRDVVRDVTDRGGVVWLLGDDRQLSAVDAGGALRLIADQVGATRLEELHRFRNRDEATASLQLRDVEPGADPFAWYVDNGRVKGGSEETLLQEQFKDWQTDTDAGLTSLMMGTTNSQVAGLNAQAQAYRIAAGTVTGRRGATLKDGHTAYRGDTVLTRKNDPLLRYNRGRSRVDNGDLWTVLRTNRDGSLLVAHQGTQQRLRLPAEYVRTSTQLGYAATVHRAQGANADLGRPLLNEMTSMESAYPAATRGKLGNYLYVVTQDGENVRDVLARIASNRDSNQSAHAMIAAEHDRVNALPTLIDQYADVHDRADATRIQHILTRALGEESAASLAGEDSFPAVGRAIRAAERAGLDPVDVVQTAWHEREFDTADDTPAVLSWRMERHIDTYTKQLPWDPDALASSTTPAVPAWIADRAAIDADRTPDTWRNHLQERYDHLALRLHEHGLQIADTRPAWTADLGPVPSPGPSRDRWVQLAAEVSVYREQHRIPDTTTWAIPTEHRSTRVGADLAARVTATHKTAELTTRPPATPERVHAEHTTAQHAVMTARTALIDRQPTATTGRALSDRSDRTPASTETRPTETRGSALDQAARAVLRRGAAPAASLPARADPVGRAQPDATTDRQQAAARVQLRHERDTLRAAGRAPEERRAVPERVDGKPARHDNPSAGSERDLER